MAVPSQRIGEWKSENEGKLELWSSSGGSDAAAAHDTRLANWPLNHMIVGTVHERLRVNQVTLFQKVGVHPSSSKLDLCTFTRAYKISRIHEGYEIAEITPTNH